MSDDVFDRLHATVVARRLGDPSASYVARLTAKGRAKLAQKLGEEAVETVIAALGDDPAALAAEAADLIFHLSLVLADAGLSFDDIRAELVRREGVSGLAEKAGRPLTAPSPPGEPSRTERGEGWGGVSSIEGRISSGSTPPRPSPLSAARGGEGAKE